MTIEEILTKFIEAVPRKMTVVVIGAVIMYKTAASPDIPDYKTKVTALACQAVIIGIGIVLHYFKETNGNSIERKVQ